MKKLTLRRPSMGWAEFDRLAEKRIKELEDVLLSKHKGKIIVVEPESGDYFLGEDTAKTTKKAREKYPDKLFFIDRVGGGGVFHFHHPKPVGWRF